MYNFRSLFNIPFVGGDGTASRAGTLTFDAGLMLDEGEDTAFRAGDEYIASRAGIVAFFGAGPVLTLLDKGNASRAGIVAFVAFVAFIVICFAGGGGGGKTFADGGGGGDCTAIVDDGGGCTAIAADGGGGGNTFAFWFATVGACKITKS